jgi:hypothetical protein
MLRAPTYNIIFVSPRSREARDSVHRGPRKNQCLFWQVNFCRPLDMVSLPISPSPEFFYSFGEGEGGGDKNLKFNNVMSQSPLYIRKTPRELSIVPERRSSGAGERRGCG